MPSIHTALSFKDVTNDGLSVSYLQCCFGWAVEWQCGAKMQWYSTLIKMILLIMTIVRVRSFSALLQSHSFMNFRPSVSNGYFYRDAPTSKLSMVLVRKRGSWPGECLYVCDYEYWLLRFSSLLLLTYLPTFKVFISSATANIWTLESWEGNLGWFKWEF